MGPLIWCDCKCCVIQDIHSWNCFNDSCSYLVWLWAIDTNATIFFPLGSMHLKAVLVRSYYFIWGVVRWRWMSEFISNVKLLFLTIAFPSTSNLYLDTTITKSTRYVGSHRVKHAMQSKLQHTYSAWYNANTHCRMMQSSGSVMKFYD